MNTLVDELNVQSTGFIKNHNFKILEYKNNQCIIEAPIVEECLNPHKIVHGGFLYGLMDTCGGVHLMLETNRKVVTISSNVNYIKACSGSKIIAKSKSIKTGKNICVIEINVYNDKDELVTTGVFNYYYID